MRSYFEKHEDILQQLNDVSSNKIIAAINNCDICFEKLNIANVSDDVAEYIFDNCRFKLNDCMIRNVISYKKKNLLKMFENQPYSTIIKLEYQPLTEYVYENMKDDMYYSSLHQVRYTKDRFNISKKDILEGRKDIIDKTVCSKTDVWSYEKEWRIVTENYIKTRPSKVDPKTRCVLYLKDNIKAFYLGAKINEKEKSEIIEFAKKNNRIVYQMILSANTYELRAERIDNV